MVNDCYVYELILHHLFRFVSITRFCSSQNLLSEKEGNGPNCSACPDQFFVPESLVMRQKRTPVHSFHAKRFWREKPCGKEDSAFSAFVFATKRWGQMENVKGTPQKCLLKTAKHWWGSCGQNKNSGHYRKNRGKHGAHGRLGKMTGGQKKRLAPCQLAAFTLPLLYFAVHSKQGIIHGLFWHGTPH